MSQASIAITSETTPDIASFLQEVDSLYRVIQDFSSELHNPEGLPVAGVHLMETLLVHGPQTVPQIGRRKLTSRQNIQVLVNRLVRAGWVYLEPNPAHKRSALVCLTDTGRRLALGARDREMAFSNKLCPAVST